MPAYNPPPQVLFSPVTNHYQGKAIRAGLASQEQDAELKGLQIESAKQANSPSAVAAAIARAELDEDKIRADIAQSKAAAKKAGVETNTATVELRGKVYGPVYEGFKAELEESGDVDLVKATQQLRAAAEQMGADELKNFDTVIDKNQDGVLSADEFAVSGIIYGISQEGGDRSPRSVLVDGKPATVFFDAAGNGYYEDGRPVLGKVTPFAVNEKGVVGADLSDAGISAINIEYRDKVMNASANAELGAELVEISNRDPAALAKSGALVNFGSEVYSTAKNLIDLVGSPELPASETAKQNIGHKGGWDWSAADEAIESLGVAPVDAARMKAGLYSIAFAAAVGEQGTRPSDVDIQAYITIYGGGLTNKDAFKGVISQAMRRQDTILRLTAELNPEIDSVNGLEVWDRSYDKFKSAINFGPTGNAGDAKSSTLRKIAGLDD